MLLHLPSVQVIAAAFAADLQLELDLEIAIDRTDVVRSVWRELARC